MDQTLKYLRSFMSSISIFKIPVLSRSKRISIHQNNSPDATCKTFKRNSTSAQQRVELRIAIRASEAFVQLYKSARFSISPCVDRLAGDLLQLASEHGPIFSSHQIGSPTRIRYIYPLETPIKWHRYFVLIRIFLQLLWVICGHSCPFLTHVNLILEIR